MNKIISLILFGFLFINLQAFCIEANAPADSKVQNTASSDEFSEVTDFNFDDNSFEISDEQFQDAKNIAIDGEDEKSFEAKVINSSHFTTNTASKTYIPLRKNQ